LNIAERSAVAAPGQSNPQQNLFAISSSL